MIKIDIAALETALRVAFETAIKKVGLANFKATSFFGSNETKADQSKAA